MDAFAITLFLETIISVAPASNVFLSPFSIAAALSLLHPAAVGDTAAELNRVIGVGSAEEALQYWQSLVPQYHGTTTAPVQFSLANGVWVSDKAQLRPAYQKAVESLESAVKPSDFVKEHQQITAEINKWVEGRTNDRIKNLIPAGALDSSTVAVLVNALFFLGKWEMKFPGAGTVKGTKFFITRQKTTEVSMMSLKAPLKHATNDVADYVQLPYEGKRFAMELIVPKAVDGIAAVLDRLRPSDAGSILETLRNASNEGTRHKVQLFLPKFTVETGGEITDLLRQAGLPRTLSDQPELSNMFEGPEKVFVSHCFHKVFMQVDEDGTEAAAATALIVRVYSLVRRKEVPIPIVRVDRPSIVLLTDVQTKNILFIGLLRNPSK